MNFSPNGWSAYTVEIHAGKATGWNYASSSSLSLEHGFFFFFFLSVTYIKGYIKAHMPSTKNDGIKPATQWFHCRDEMPFFLPISVIFCLFVHFVTGPFRAENDGHVTLRIDPSKGLAASMFLGISAIGALLLSTNAMTI